MSRAVLISIRPKWCELIASGKKTIEVRKTAPKIKTPFKCYIYETRGFERVGNENLNCVVGGNGRGAVIGEFICNQIEEIAVAFDGGSGPMKVIGGNEVWYGGMVQFLSRLSTEDICRYIGGIGRKGYGWHISAMKMYDEPLELSEFYRWYDGKTDMRPCENGKKCDHLIFDYSEDHEACGIDYDGENCPLLKVTRPPQSYMYVEELTT